MENIEGRTVAVVGYSYVIGAWTIIEYINDSQVHNGSYDSFQDAVKELERITKENNHYKGGQSG